jgi:predicted Zn-dependent protease
MKGKRILPVMAMFAFGLILGTGIVLANHPWICTGSTAYHFGSRTVRYASPIEENAAGAITRNPQSYVNAFNGSIAVWNPTVMNLIQGGTVRLRLFYDQYGRNGWLGLASIGGISNCVIGNASSRLNDSYLLDTARYSQTAVNHVACQEVGHTFGLNHNRSSSTTCMNDTILTAGNQINQHDRDLLAQIYANIP